MMKITLRRLLEQYPDKIREADDESRSGDGYWLHLKTGWQQAPHTHVHSVHEWNMRELTKAMKWVAPCDCPECRSQNKG